MDSQPRQQKHAGGNVGGSMRRRDISYANVVRGGVGSDVLKKDGGGAQKGSTRINAKQGNDWGE